MPALRRIRPFRRSLARPEWSEMRRRIHAAPASGARHSWSHTRRPGLAILVEARHRGCAQPDKHNRSKNGTKEVRGLAEHEEALEEPRHRQDHWPETRTQRPGGARCIRPGCRGKGLREAKTKHVFKLKPAQGSTCTQAGTNRQSKAGTSAPQTGRETSWMLPYTPRFPVSPPQ